MINENERKQRLSVVCKKLRGSESLRAFTKKRSQELSGIGFTTWGAWERGKADLSKESLERLVNFIGCSYQDFSGYLDGFVTLEELFQPSSTDSKQQEKIDFSPEVAREWVKTLNARDKLFIASQTLQSFQFECEELIEVKAKEKVKLLLNLLCGSIYPEDSQIEAAAQKLDISVEDLRKLCDRLFTTSN